MYHQKPNIFCKRISGLDIAISDFWIKINLFYPGGGIRYWILEIWGLDAGRRRGWERLEVWKLDC
jgi:hypothetical protein